MSVSGEEDPARCAPRPLAHAPVQAEAHPLLDVSLTPEKGGGILRRETAERRRGRRQVRFDVSDKDCGRPLAAPRVHSSAALRSEVRREAQQTFDAESAVRSELLRSFTVRRGVESEAARALNVCRVHSLYQGLVSVEPPSEQIQRLTARQRRPEQREIPVTDAWKPRTSQWTDCPR
ncbi:protein phosphatase 1 regulatory subunit 35 isoform X2 [Dendrobates tinctorius]|uniref:protein phosphatase 1 regulatory subunit 35 isoform X2 n=1 Tax=Dendrobates tinctorius TaxID=92724 RepID=UPI003CC9C745